MLSTRAVKLRKHLAERKRARQVDRTRLAEKACDTEPGEPGSWQWDLMEWADDIWAQHAVRQNPQGMTLAHVGRVLGVTRQRVEQIEAEAITKLRHMAERGLIDREELRGLLLAWRQGAA